jgi:hypothetical protein
MYALKTKAPVTSVTALDEDTSLPCPSIRIRRTHDVSKPGTLFDASPAEYSNLLLYAVRLASS